MQNTTPRNNWTMLNKMNKCGFEYKYRNEKEEVLTLIYGTDVVWGCVRVRVRCVRGGAVVECFKALDFRCGGREFDPRHGTYALEPGILSTLIYIAFYRTLN